MTKKKDDATWRLLRWYPPAWRQRYGDELAALFDDSFGGRPVPRRVRMATMRSGLVERVRARGLRPGPADSPEVRWRAGSLLVLCGWASVTIGGAMYAKFNENWGLDTPRADRWVPTVGYDTTRVAAVLGLAILVSAALITLPALARSLRLEGWALVRRQVKTVVAVGMITVLISTPVVIWAQHLSTRERNGGLDIYTVAFFALCVCVVFVIVTATWAVVSVVSTVEIPRRSLRWLGGLACGMSLMVFAVLTGLLVWWIPLALTAPSALGGAIPVDLVLAGSFMTLGCLTAVMGLRQLAANPLS